MRPRRSPKRPRRSPKLHNFPLGNRSLEKLLAVVEAAERHARKHAKDGSDCDELADALDALASDSEGAA